MLSLYQSTTALGFDTTVHMNDMVSLMLMVMIVLWALITDGGSTCIMLILKIIVKNTVHPRLS